jgi:nitroreductase
MNLVDAIYHRRAVRNYSEQLVEEDKIRFLIAAAVQAPSALNRQPWSFVVVTDRVVIEHLGDNARKYMLANLSKLPHLGEYRPMLSSPNFYIFHRAPVLIVICATMPDRLARQDCCLAAENLMLAAHGVGLGTCWIGLAEPWLNQPAGKDAVKIPAEHAAVAPIVIGYPASVSVAPPRRPPHITWVEG